MDFTFQKKWLFKYTYKLLFRAYSSTGTSGQSCPKNPHPSSKLNFQPFQPKERWLGRRSSWGSTDFSLFAGCRQRPMGIEKPTAWEATLLDPKGQTSAQKWGKKRQTSGILSCFFFFFWALTYSWIFWGLITVEWILTILWGGVGFLRFPSPSITCQVCSLLVVVVREGFGISVSMRF